MTPVSSTFTIKKELTGYENDQEIKPQELDLWRVLKINEDGTIDMISEYTSSNKITFKGETGYKNYIGALNDMASAYTNSKYTVGSRYPGYNGQTEFITETLSLENLDIEASGTVKEDNTGLHMNDLNLIQSMLHTWLAYSVGQQDDVPVGYWFSGRRIMSSYKHDYDFDELFLILKVWDSNGNINHDSLYGIGGKDGPKVFAGSNYVRPIVTLKSNLTSIEGDGKKEKPWKFE